MGVTIRKVTFSEISAINTPVKLASSNVEHSVQNETCIISQLQATYAITLELVAIK